MSTISRFWWYPTSILISNTLYFIFSFRLFLRNLAATFLTFEGPFTTFEGPFTTSEGPFKLWRKPWTWGVKFSKGSVHLPFLTKNVCTQCTSPPQLVSSSLLKDWLRKTQKTRRNATKFWFFTAFRSYLCMTLSDWDDSGIFRMLRLRAIRWYMLRVMSCKFKKWLPVE